jgi:hypothetical protein
MQEDRAFWPTWAQFLQDRGARELVASLLEGAGPLRIIVSQLMFAGRPFLGSGSTANQWQAFADLLDDQEKTTSFVSFLREEGSKS